MQVLLSDLVKEAEILFESIHKEFRNHVPLDPLTPRERILVKTVCYCVVFYVESKYARTPPE